MKGLIRKCLCHNLTFEQKSDEVKKDLCEYQGRESTWPSLDHVPILNQSVWPEGWIYADGPPGPHDTQIWGED